MVILLLPARCARRDRDRPGSRRHQVAFDPGGHRGALLDHPVLRTAHRLTGSRPPGGLRQDGGGRAASTSAACVSGFTRRIALATLPSASITNVERSIPIDFLPYMFRSFQTPYCSATSCSGSASNVNGSEYFCLNLTCEASSSGLTPRTTAPRSWKSA